MNEQSKSSQSCCFVVDGRFELDPRWSDTGDRYILKLFRDYVFHSIAVDGSPILDLSHVLVCLNKVRHQFTLGRREDC